jgi:membrane associated rhomboid family serine protease
MQLRITSVVKTLLIACFAMFIVQQTVDQYLGGNVTGLLGLVPYEFINNYHFWQIFTYQFLHGDVLHLFLNLMMLVFIGSELETVWGKWRFLRFYLACAMSAAVFYLMLQIFLFGSTGLHIPMIGASGAIYGLIIAYGLIFSEREMLFMMAFPLKAKHFMWILVAMELMVTVFSGRGGGLSAAAHLGGAVAGFIYLWVEAMIIIKRRKNAGGDDGGRGRRASEAKHLKLVVNKPGEKTRLEDDKTDPGNSPPTWH